MSTTSIKSLNKYEFRNPLNNREVAIYRAKSYREAAEQVRSDNNGDFWSFTRGWSSDGEKTWDLWEGLLGFPAVIKD